MDGIITYGSLLSADTLDAIFGDNAQYTPARVTGWRRCFNQTAAYRESENGATGVLNVIKDDGSWFNGILVTNLSRTALDTYREREAGYDITTITGDAVEPYTDDSSLADSSKEFGLATGNRTESDIDPIPAYASECINGAAGWGDDFLTDFLLTTHES